MTQGHSAFPNEPKLSRPIVVVIPTYGAADHLAVCLSSLQANLPFGASVCVVDDCTPDDSIREVCARANATAAWANYFRRPENRGFVETCNWALEHLRPAGSDLLLLNSDTEVTPHFLEEMQAVLDLDEKHAAVSPRSNNATLFSVPPLGAPVSPAEAYSLWLTLRDDLPRFHVVPTAVGFCMLIKAVVLDRFGKLFDPIYSPGYNEENDFLCRINRYGYSPVSANWAFVYHYESSSFSSRRLALEDKNRQVLDNRYPEYQRKVQDYFEFDLDPVERFAALRLPHKPRVLFDLSHLGAVYNGTSEYALNLLRELRALQPSYELHLGMKANEGADFFAREIRGYPIFEYGSSDSQVFDLAFRPAQFFKWRDFAQFSRLAPRIAFTLQDIIGVRCEYLNSAYRRRLFVTVAKLADSIFTISQYSRQDFASYYGLDLPMKVIQHGTDVNLLLSRSPRSNFVLVIGNEYAHKAVPEVLECLGDRLEIVVLGGSDSCPVRSNITRYPSGHLSKQKMILLYSSARIIVYPSLYEGFGLPVIDALALGKPVVALNTQINRELASSLQDENLHLVETFQDFRSAIEALDPQPAEPPPAHMRGWAEVARDYATEFDRLIRSEIHPQNLRNRWNMLATVSAISAPSLANVLPTTQTAKTRRKSRSR